jgi:hypothetical protein
MNRLDKITAAVLMLCASGVLVIFAWYVPPAMNALTRAANGAGDTFDTINRPCGTGKPCGTLADVNQTLHTVRGTFGEVEVAARHENAQLTTLDGQERDLFAGVQGVLKRSRETLASVSGFASAASATMGTVKETVAGAQPVLVSLKTTSDDLGGAAQALGETADAATMRFNDPHVAALVANLDATSKNAAGATADVKTVFDRVANPQPCKGRWCFAIKTAHIMSAARDVPEFGYWASQFVQSLSASH